MFFGSRKKARQAAAGRNSTSGGAKGKMKHVSYCPECPIPDLSHPETAVRVTGVLKGKKVSCIRGHKWVVV